MNIQKNFKEQRHLQQHKSSAQTEMFLKAVSYLTENGSAKEKTNIFIEKPLASCN